MSARLSRTSPDAGRSVNRLDLGAQQLVEHGDQLQQARAAAVGHVEHPAGHVRRVGRQQVAMHDVGHIREVARLPAVAIDRRLPAGQHGRDEQRNHGRVLAVRILPRAEDVEVADRHGLETVRGRERPGSNTRPPAWRRHRAKSGRADRSRASTTSAGRHRRCSKPHKPVAARRPGGPGRAAFSVPVTQAALVSSGCSTLRGTLARAAS